jgi:hypothetical protein
MRSRGVPKQNGVVDITSVVSKMTGILAEDVLLVYRKVQCGVGRCRRCAHGGAGKLDKQLVVEFEDVVMHDDVKAID